MCWEMEEQNKQGEMTLGMGLGRGRKCFASAKVARLSICIMDDF